MDVTQAYSRRAVEYTEVLGAMDAVHPSDRQVIDSWADEAPGRLLDAGCGPGHLTRHLSERGHDVRGIDRVPEFLDHARRSHPGVQFDFGDIDDIDEADGSLGGILSWFSTIHHDPAHIDTPVSEFARTLQTDGLLLLGHFDSAAVEPFDHKVAPAWRWSSEALCDVLRANGFEIIATHRRTGEGHRPIGVILARRNPLAIESRWRRPIAV